MGIGESAGGVARASDCGVSRFLPTTPHFAIVLSPPKSNMDPYQEDEKADDEFRRAWLDQSCRLAPDMIWEKFRQAPDGVWTKD